MSEKTSRWPVALALAAFVAGVLGEGLMFFRAQAREAERLLSDDMRVIVFLNAEVDEALASVVGERISAAEGAASVEYVTPEDALARIEARDPTVFRSVAVIGENPLPGAFEVRLRDEALGRVAEWAGEIQAFDEVDEVLFKPLQVRVLLQVRLYERFASAVGALSASVVSLWAAWLFFGFLRSGRGGPRLWPELAARAGVSMVFAAAGIAAAAGLSSPAGDGWIAVSVAWSYRAALLALAAFAGAASAAPVRETAGVPFAGRERRKIGAVLAAASLLMSSTGVQAASVRSKRQELKKVTKELEKQKQAVEQRRRRKVEEEKRLRRLRGEKRSVASRVEKLEKSHRAADDERLRLDARLRSISHASEASQGQLAREVGAYRRSTVGVDGFYESDALWEEAFRRAAIRDKTLYVAQLRMMDVEALGARNKAMIESERIQRKTVAEMRRLKSTEKRMAATRTQVNRAATEVRTAEKKLKALETSARQLAGLIRELTRRQAGKKPHGVVPVVAKGSLAWPILGQVVERFGKRRVPELGTWTISNGIEISARRGTVVKPVRSGKVIFSGPFRSYGNVIIVNHGKGFYSIYGHLAELLRAKGDKVRKSTTIAKIGGSSGKLYLEFRQGGKAFDPLPYLTSGSVSKR
jgi:septal ring factor EnvC (AmiA/AmiB activator)